MLHERRCAKSNFSSVEKDAPRKMHTVSQSLSELRVLRLCRIWPPSLLLLLFPGSSHSLGRFPQGVMQLWKRVEEKGFCQNNLSKEASHLILKCPGNISDFTVCCFKTCTIFPAKEHQKLFVRVAIILSNMGQAEVKSSQNLHIKDEQG